MRSLVPGMFMSKLIYATQLTSSVWGLSEYGEHELNKLSCPKEVILKLQSAQRQAASLLCPDLHVDQQVPTARVLHEANLLSVHQQAALSILTLALRVLHTGKPGYLATRLIQHETKGRTGKTLKVPKLRLNLSHEGFINQATRLINKLPMDIVHEPSVKKRKRLLKDWVSSNISVKP